MFIWRIFICINMGVTMAGKIQLISEFDKRLGRMIVIHRARYGLSQKDLARVLGCSFQQVQKYECGGNRMSVARLYNLCEYFRIPIGAFLQEVGAEYIHDPKMARIIRNIYNMGPVNVDLVLQLTENLCAARAGRTVTE